MKFLLVVLAFVTVPITAVRITSSSPPVDLTIDPRGNPNFRGAVEACFELFLAAGGETADLLNAARAANPPRITVRPTARPVNWTGRTPPPGDANQRPDGTPGPGTGSRIGWDPNNTTNLEPGVPRDPCASLLHELKHAVDNRNGRRSRRQLPAPQPGSGIPQNEVDASREENRYREARGLPQRTRYGRPLPPDAIF